MTACTQNICSHCVYYVILCKYICVFVLQLLASTIQHEKAELEQRKSELLKKEEELKVQLAALEESLLQELAMAKGNILENKILLESLNETKAKYQML